MVGHYIFAFLLVFFIVLIPYQIMQALLSPKTSASADDSSEGRNLPPVFKMIWKGIVYLSDPMDAVAAAFPPELKTCVGNWLTVADIRMELKHLIAASVCLAMALVAASLMLCMSFTTNPAVLFPFALIATVLGIMYPFTTVQDIAQKRQQKIMKSLPFALDLICSAIRSGIDFNASVAYLVKSDTERGPLTVEFGKLLQAIQLGRTRVEAIEEMAARIQIPEFTSFASAVSHSSEAGSSIVETLKVQAREMRRARFNRAERKAARAASAMIFPIAAFIMPAMVLIIATPIVMQLIKSGAGDIMK